MTSAQYPTDASAASPKSTIAKKWLIGILVLTFAFVLMPFLLWYMTTFSRPLTDAELGTYFTDAAHPRRAQRRIACDSRLGHGSGQSITGISRRAPEAIDGR